MKKFYKLLFKSDAYIQMHFRLISIMEANSANTMNPDQEQSDLVHIVCNVGFKVHEQTREQMAIVVNGGKRG